MTLVKANPFTTLMTDIFENNRLLNPDFYWGNWEKKIPAANIKETDTAYNIELVAPGLTKDDFKISLENGNLLVSAEKETEKNEDTKQYTRKEFSYNSFERSFRLPENVKADDISAQYDNGLLKLNIPKVESDKKNIRKEIKLS